MLIQIVKKQLFESLRRRQTLILLILVPIGFFGFFGFIFSPQDPGATTRSIGYVIGDSELGYEFDTILPSEFQVSSNTSSMESLFLDLLETNPKLIVDTNIEISLRSYTNQDELEGDIETQSLSLGVVFDINFTDAIMSNYNQMYAKANGSFDSEYPSSINSTVILIGDPSIQQFQSAQSIFLDALSSFTEQIYGPQVFSNVELTGGNLNFDVTGIEREERSQFEFFAPGFLVFVILLQMVSISGMLTREKESKTINRMRMSLMPTWKLFAGLIITQFILSTIQIGISFVIISFFGLEASVEDWVNVYIVLQITAFNIAGIAMVVASWAKTTNDALSLTSILSAPIGFLSGAFLPVPDVYVIESLDLQIWDIIPTYHSNTAITEILLNGAGLGDVLKSMSFLFVFACLWLVIGLVAYRKRVIQGDL